MKCEITGNGLNLTAEDNIEERLLQHGAIRGFRVRDAFVNRLNKMGEFGIEIEVRENSGNE